MLNGKKKILKNINSELSLLPSISIMVFDCLHEICGSGELSAINIYLCEGIILLYKHSMRVFSTCVCYYTLRTLAPLIHFLLDSLIVDLPNFYY